MKRALKWIAMALGISLGVMLAVEAQAAGYTHYLLGQTRVKTSGKVEPGLLLMGGGVRDPEALRWFMRKAGGGHVVVLRTSQGGELGEEFFHRIGGVASVETFVFHGPEAAHDPAVLRRLRRADGIFLAGGDQARYVRYWRGSPLLKLLDAHVRAGKPLGGTSAGLAVLGQYLYGAMDGGSQTSPRALADPFGDGNTIETDFLHLDVLRGIVTDTHFSERKRLGRLLAFMAKAERLSGQTVLGLGVDEDAALTVEGDGQARLHAARAGAGASVVKGGFPPGLEMRPLELAGVDVIRMGPDSVLHLPSGEVRQPLSQRRYAVREGILVALQWPLLVIHGGAGAERAELSEADIAAARQALQTALRVGHAQLRQGRSALDAVSAAVTVLEDAPQFNAGRGAVFTHDGRNELDASIMDGASGKAGAVAGVRVIRNPVLLARAVLERSRHVMLIGEGAEQFAREQGIEQVDPAWFRTEKRWQYLQRLLREEARTQTGSQPAATSGKTYFGTVGALALDRHGYLAAATSTGGMTNKRHGRVGDSPIIGAGTWADRRCAVSGTGWGEFYIRAAAAHEICARLAHAGQSLQQAATDVINREIPAAGGDGGAIALTADGELSLPFNTEGMYRGWIGPDGIPHVAIFADEPLPQP